MVTNVIALFGLADGVGAKSGLVGESSEINCDCVGNGDVYIPGATSSPCPLEAGPPPAKALETL